MTGSGLTRLHGHPSWDEALARFVALTIDSFRKRHSWSENAVIRNPEIEIYPTPVKPAALKIFRQLSAICQIDPNINVPNDGGRASVEEIGKIGTDKLIVAVELCEDLLDEMDSNISEQDVYDNVREQYGSSYQTSTGDKHGNAKLSLRNHELIQDVLRYTRSKRILTTNYDVEIERSLDEKLLKGYGSETQFKEWRHLVNSDHVREYRNTSVLLERRIAVPLGAGAQLVSNSINRDNVGDLVNFATYSRRGGYQVFHLHGRYDQPHDMVLTQRDYRNVYARDPAGEEAFHAAQEMLFGGNDVLMLGFGASEEDLMRPFRKFVQQGRGSGYLPRRTFALMPSTDPEGDRRSQKGMGARNKAAITPDDVQAMELAQKFDIYTIHYGGPRYHRLLKSVKKLIEITTEKNVIHPRTTLRRAWNIALETISSDNQRSPEEQPLVNVDWEDFASLFKPNSPGRVTVGGKNRRNMLEYLAEIENTIRFRAMLYELQDLNRMSRHWWDSWRHLPYERRARYHIASGKIVGRDNYLSVRHCSTSRSDAYGVDSQKWSILRQIQNIDKEKIRKTDFERRILRVTMPRGGGKGTLVSLLHREAHQRFIFSHPGDNGPVYQAAFIAHLSFSMEFNSVIKALTRFIALQLAETLNTSCKSAVSLNIWLLHPRSAANPISRIQKLFADTVERNKQRLLGFKNYQNDLPDESAFEQLIRLIRMTRIRDETLKHALSKAKDSLGLRDIQLNPDQLNLLARRMAIAEFEDDQSALFSALDVSSDSYQSGRPHRLDVLRITLAAYAAIAPNARLFICLGGLERISDENGDAYNPAHRAFFRFLTGTEDREPTGDWTETLLRKAPLDLVFIAGNPEAPICYLSEETDPKLVKIGDMQLHSSRSATKRLLKRWTELDRLDWRSRLRVVLGESNENSLCQVLNQLGSGEAEPQEHDQKSAAATFLLWAETTRSGVTQRPLRQLRGSDQIHRLLSENVILSYWVMTAWVFRGSEITSAAGPAAFDSYLEHLDSAAARDGAEGVIEYLLTGYRKLDSSSDNNDAPLIDLILEHLSLFALPVEPWVLLGCPEIQACLRSDYMATELHDISRGLFPLGDRPSELDVTTAFAHSAWIERAYMFARLYKALNTIEERGLLIRVRPAMDDPGTAPASQELEPGEAFLHQRFSIHGLLRQHLAHKMSLALHDGADLNHHRMSIYCDQPRDLPSPNARHFERVEKILSTQLDDCRDTLWSIYQLSREKHDVQKAMQGWDPTPHEQEDVSLPSAEFAAARRLFAPEVIPNEVMENLFKSYIDGNTSAWNDPDGVAGGLGRIHAVPQRLRAMLSLIQGSFSIGSLSRLGQSDRLSHKSEKPFDAYRSWLRSLLNAATSLERTRGEITDLFNDRTLQTGGTGNEASPWLRHHQTGSPSPPEEILNAIDSEEKIRKAASDLKFSRRQTTSYKTLRHPFYRDEIAWLLNERGVTALTQGIITDALPLLKQASFVMSHKRTPQTDSHAFHAAERRILLNYAIAQIERGHIGRARRNLMELKTSSVTEDSIITKGQSTPSEIYHFSQLYLGLCDQLSGDHRRARESFKKVRSEFSDKQQLRGVAIVTRFNADLLRARGKLEEAESEARLAISSASRAEQRDVEHLALVSHACILIEQGNTLQAQEQISRALSYADNMGLFAAQADAKVALARLMIKQGDHSLAGQYAAEAAAIAVRNGLRLRKLRAVLTFAESRIHRRSHDFATRLLNGVVHECEELGYQTAASKANTHLSKLKSMVATT